MLQSVRAVCCLRGGRCMSQTAGGVPARGQHFMVVGLGNHGMAGTRHSVGMTAINQLARRLNVADQWKTDRRIGADLVTAQLDGANLILIKPRHLMNVNGTSVSSAAGKFRLTAGNIYLLHDELDKPLGKVTLKLGGSASVPPAVAKHCPDSRRGHNGVRSCIDHLKSDTMIRLLIGIGRPADKSSVTMYVLGRFTRSEQELLSSVLEKGLDLLLGHIQKRTRDTTSATATVESRV